MDLLLGLDSWTASNFSQINRCWNSREWDFNLEYGNILIWRIGYKSFERRCNERHAVLMTMFDRLTMDLEEGQPLDDDGEPIINEDLRAERRELLVKLRIQNLVYIDLVQSKYLQQKYYGN